MTIAQWARKEKFLGACFFCAYDEVELSDPALVFPTLALELARFDPQYERALYELLKDKYIVPANLATQFNDLIRGPLSACQVERPIIIVLDALDECSPKEDVDEILRILLQLDVGLRGWKKLRILITSRPAAYSPLRIQ